MTRHKIIAYFRVVQPFIIRALIIILPLGWPGNFKAKIPTQRQQHSLIYE